MKRWRWSAVTKPWQEEFFPALLTSTTCRRTCTELSEMREVRAAWVQAQADAFINAHIAAAERRKKSPETTP